MRAGAQTRPAAETPFAASRQVSPEHPQLPPTPLLTTAATPLPAVEFLRACGEVFARFGEETQDSGNISYGVDVDGRRFFVKTPGDLGLSTAWADHRARGDLLRNAAVLARSLTHRALPTLHHVVEAPDGPLLVYDWVEGLLLRVEAEERTRPGSSFYRFVHLPQETILRALDEIYEVHRRLAERGWIACDFYDGCVIYDFDREAVHIVDLDNYQRGPFVNEMGRMFGSTRFMAPEEFTRGARIDEGTTVFTMGRAAAVFFEPTGVPGELREVVERACREEPAERYPTMAAFHEAWMRARDGAGTRQGR